MSGPNPPLFTETVQNRIQIDGSWQDLNEKAARLYESVLEEAPRDELALTTLTAHLRETDDMSAFVNTALELSARKETLGLISSALEDLEAVVGMPLEAGDESYALGNLGNLYQTRGQLDQAEEMYRKALQMVLST